MHTVAPWGRSGDDLLLLYTGGTTGMPKGVMWRQDDLFSVARRHLSSPRSREGVDLDIIRNGVQAPGPIGMPGLPPDARHRLLHASSSSSASAAAIVTLDRPQVRLRWSCSTRSSASKVQQMAIVGDAFAKPILEPLDAEPGRWDLSSLFMIISSGVMWSEDTKQRPARATTPA